MLVFGLVFLPSLQEEHLAFNLRLGMTHDSVLISEFLNLDALCQLNVA